MNIFDHLICPICSSSFSLTNASLKCEQNHSFDLSSSGYVNLLKPGKKNNARAGDSREMIKARRDFFQSNAYSPIRDKICSLVEELSPTIVVDAGCGEGYYTEAIAKCHTPLDVIGVDMSKFGCEYGAKSAKRNGIDNVIYCVGSIFELPVPSSYVDVIVNLFAPVASEEFYRTLKPGGCFIVASAGIDHLDGLKSLLYTEAYKNEEKFLDFEGFRLIKRENLKYSITIKGSETIYNLFTMTPYYHRTSLSDKEKLRGVDEITTNVEVNFLVYKKI